MRRQTGYSAPRLGLAPAPWAALGRIMYEEYFGLARNPFQPVAEGEAIYEGPEQAKVIADLKIALTARDSIAVLTGPVGVGKTTIATRALEEMGSERLVARLGRTQVGSDELVDLLLAQIGNGRESTRRFECLKSFNRILSERAASGGRTFIVIEDAERLGADLLEELEALTATDDGASAGANIILMGPQKLDKLIAAPALERLRQRIRLQQVLERFTAEQVEHYLRHRITAAGGDFDAIFEEGTAFMVRRCSGGIPRVINGLCETALTLAAENQRTRVTARTLFKVAVEVFGMQPGKVPPATPAKPETAAQPNAPEAKTPKVLAAKLPEPADDKPAPVAVKPKPPARISAETTGPVKNIPAAPEAKPKAQQAATPAVPEPEIKSTSSPEPSPPAADAPSSLELEPEPKPQLDATIPDPPNLGIQNYATAAAEAKPESRKPTPAPAPTPAPKFKFADDIVVDRNTQPTQGLATERRPVTPPEPPTLTLEDSIPKIADEAPKTGQAPVPPPAAANDDPTPGESSRVEKPGPTAEKPVADAAQPAPAVESVPASIELPGPPAAKRSEPVADEPTACFAKVDHDMLDAALADLAEHDDEDGPEPASETPDDDDKPADAIPEVTLDSNIAAEKPAATAETDPAVLANLAADMEKAESLEDVSDKLAETLFGCDVLEAISLKIREDAAQNSPDMQQPADADAGAAAVPQKPVAAVEKSVEPAAEKPVPPESVPQAQTIENQLSESMTNTLPAPVDHGSQPPDDDDTRKLRTQLLARLKESFEG